MKLKKKNYYMRVLFEVYGGILGLLFLIGSIALFGASSLDPAFIIGLLTLVSLSPFVTINSFREKYLSPDTLSSVWKGKFGTILHLANTFNLFWLGFLTYQLFESVLLVVLIIIFQWFILPRIVISFFAKRL